VPVMQELFGYLLYKEYKIEKAFMFNGSGRNGKSKVLELMKRFLGIYNCVNIPLQEFEENQFAMGELLNKMANLGADLSTMALKTTGKFKNLTGRDMITASRKFLPKVSFYNYAKMIFCSNELPITYDTTDAFWNRWVLLDFPNTFLSAKEAEKQLENNKTGVKIAIPEIIDKIATNDELSGLLNWALEGLDRLLKTGDFSYSKGVQEVKQMWMRRSNSFLGFINDCLEESYDHKVPKADLRKAYSDYCKKYKLKVASDRLIKDTLETEFGSTFQRVKVEGDYIRCWEGIKFVNELEASVQLVQDVHGFSLYRKKVNLDIGVKTMDKLDTLEKKKKKIQDVVVENINDG
jgi:putative DNA primase/helicase